jgi:hypothetical protein
VSRDKVLLGFLHVFNVACNLLKSACPGCNKLCYGRLSSRLLTRVWKIAASNAVQFLELVAAATAPYLKESANQFASELWKFVASGLSIQAHDRLVFGTHDVEDRQRAKGAPMSAAGAPDPPSIAGSTNMPPLILTLLVLVAVSCVFKRRTCAGHCSHGLHIRDVT